MTTVHTVKSKVEISQNFVAFSEYMNFTIVQRACHQYFFSWFNNLILDLFWHVLLSYLCIFISYAFNWLISLHIFFYLIHYWTYFHVSLSMFSNYLIFHLIRTYLEVHLSTNNSTAPQCNTSKTISSFHFLPTIVQSARHRYFFSWFNNLIVSYVFNLLQYTYH